MARPLLILSDSPTLKTGLGRESRELAIQIFNHLPNEFRVGTAGLGGHLSRELPFFQSRLSRMEPFPPELPEIWRDFAGNQRGILLTIANPCWLAFLAQGLINLPAEYRAWLDEKPFEVWSYVPIDAVGPNDRLCKPEKLVLEKMDRLLAYTKWGATVLDRTLGGSHEHIPHGLDVGYFYPRDRQKAREQFVLRATQGKLDGKLAEDNTLIGIIATNTRRKDWYLAFEVARELKRSHQRFSIWAHTNKLLGEWDLLTLAEEFGIEKHIIFSTCDFSDEYMAWMYSACDVVMGIGKGEGWGLPLSEAIACGVPVIHGNYAGATDFIPPNCLVEPLAFFGDGVYCAKRPVFLASEWAQLIQRMKERPEDFRRESLGVEYHWKNCWPRWEEWLKAGL